MSLFEQTIPVPIEEITRIVAEHWNLEIQVVIKASQNHTFRATDTNGQLYAVRVTPDPTNKYFQRISDEIFFTQFISTSGLVNHVCVPVPNLSGEPFLRIGDFSIAVFRWAKGSPIDYPSFTWMTNEKLIKAWGRWFGEFHVASRLFSEKYPEISSRIQRWDQTHQEILKGSDIHPDDESVVTDGKHYGVLHGDLNVSNFFYVEEEDILSVFDWDQVQQGWFLWDLAQAELGVYMLYEAGAVVSGEPVPQANPEFFRKCLVEGYESVDGSGVVDTYRLDRMVLLRKSFYERFCRKAQVEGVPEGMKAFIDYVVNWFDKQK